MARRIFPTSRFGLATLFGVLAAGAALVPGDVPEAFAQEPAACLSQDPAQWPAPNKPYFMLLQDTSGSMTTCTNPVTANQIECPSNFVANSCGLVPSRINDAKCALRQTVQAFSGQVNFGLFSFATEITNCPAGACVSDCGTSGNQCLGEAYGCDVLDFPNGNGTGCGNRPDCDSGAGPALPNFAEGAWNQGGNLLVPLKRDIAGAVDNTGDLLAWFDAQCGDDRELYAAGLTPLGGLLQSATQYLRSGWNQWTAGPNPAGDYCTNLAFASGGQTPLTAADPACRSVNVILITDGDETCGGNANAAATDLFTNGVTIGGRNWRVPVYVINFAGGTQANTDAIALAGGTGTSLFATNETTLASALADIISGSVAPEECDNTDNNCNGCTDEGYRHYCNTNPVCCAGNRATCQAQYEASITPADPDGNLALLPCTTAQQQAAPATWLCDNPGETCDNADNNCVDGSDEGVLKCGNPATCPTGEVCNGRDDDCDGSTDELVCGACVPQAELCNGCDDDCDGQIDEGIAPIACGTSGACAGTRTCTPGPTGVTPGSCQGAPTFGACSAQGSAETCNGVDDDCDGQIDDGVPPRACVPGGTDPALVYGGTSQCVQGQQACTGNGGVNPYGTCIGFQGPSPEVCDGVDNDCDGTVDEGSIGVGQPCGLNAPPVCNPGLTVCTGGALDCDGDETGSPESCNGIDDDCDGSIDDAPLTDAPAAGSSGCWEIAGNCCSHDGFTWCPPDGATCNGIGSLGAPCSLGTLTCAGGAWTCASSVNPDAEVCDGLDNDCDAAIDEGDFPEEGEVCGDGDLPCETGLTECAGGFIDCVGDVPPAAEVCDGVDNDCDTFIDEGLIEGTGTCIPDYDEDDYPGERIFPSGPCQLGTLVCDGKGGTRCDGGSGPQPETCDGLDNDCDGLADESEGDPPDSVDGTENPDDPDQHIGDPCGITEGTCAEGALACLNGRFECLGGQPPQVETCDCEDNDCDGSNDNPNPGNDPPLCSAGKDCIKSNDQCQCAAPCGSGEFPCPSGQACEVVTASESGEVLGEYCVATFCPGGCEDKTFTDADGNVLCAPAGTQLDDCRTVPVCECAGQNGCVSPCFGVTCEGSLTCARFGDQAGTCVPDNCFNVGCQGCDVFCGEGGLCVGNPCADNDCASNEACFPDEDGEGFTCKPTCLDVDCDDGTICKAGECVADCSPSCGDDQVCDFSQTPAECVDSQCNEDSCPNGGCCDPFTGACGACPCEGVTCPGEAVCVADECVDPDQGTTGSGGGGPGATTSTSAGGEGASSAATGSTGANTPAGAGGGASTGGVFGLATGGGGCACEVGAGADDRDVSGRFAAVAAAALLLAARRRRGQGAARTRAAAVAKEVVR